MDCYFWCVYAILCEFLFELIQGENPRIFAKKLIEILNVKGVERTLWIVVIDCEC
jgi:hypothetical protein